MTGEINVALVGQRFMGRAHANAYRQVGAFLSPALRPRLRVACGRDEPALREFASRFGWEEITTDWRAAVDRDDVQLVDICASNDLHREIAERAAEAGKAVFCEKPLARTLAEARAMCAAVHQAGVPHMVCFNYRFFPALQLAKRLIDEGAIGRPWQFRAIYLQDWLCDPAFPLQWRMRREQAGSGALGDTAVHLVDLARFLVGEVEEVVGALTTLIPERPLPGGEGTGAVTVDDTAAFLARLEGGVTGVFETTRMATGRKNFMHLEVNGDRGSIFWNAEELNALWYCSRQDAPHARGFRRILATEPAHPYAGQWWPPGHILGYEHSFVHAVHELLAAVAAGRPARPDFQDGLAAQAVLEAVLKSTTTGSWVRVAEVS
ncbi:MAG: Gfo/Idh/MocA family protein [Candidatus Bipolaricaulaceae bacterium]